LTISGTGITNNSGITQNFVSGINQGRITFTNSATAGSMTSFTNNGSTVSGQSGGVTRFVNTSNAGSAMITSNGGTISGAFGGITEFFDSSDAGSATLIANAGTGSGGGEIRFRDNSLGGTSTVKVFGNGILDISLHNSPGLTIGSLEGSGSVRLGANNLTAGANSASTTFSGVMQDGGFGGGTGGSLTKTGTGTLTLSGANTYTGATMVNGGTLLVNGSTSSSSAVTVNSGGTLGGTGLIGGPVTVASGGNLSPGTSPGILNTGAVTLNSGSNFLIDINGPTVGTDYDQLNVTGTVTLNGGNLVLTIGGTLTVGEQFTIINNDLGDAVVGMFAQGSSVTSGSDTFSINYAGGDGNDVTLTVVPEPSTWLGGFLACTFVTYTQRRRFAQMLRRA